MERAVLFAETESLEAGDFEIGRTVRAAAAVSAGEITLPEQGMNIEDVERRLVTLALERTKGNQTRAAALLGLHRDQIRYRIEKFGLKANDKNA